MKISVVDLSHWNMISESLEEAAAAGVLGVIHKCTEGMSPPDDTVVARHSLARDAGMLWGIYHFLRPGSMVDQVQHFLAEAKERGVLDERTLVACDYEDDRVSLDDVVRFLSTLAQESGRSPVLYSGAILKEQLGGRADPRLTGYRLWLAQYATKPVLPAGWSSYWLWQYSDGSAGPKPHTVPGISSPVDCNDYQGTADALRAEWAGAAPAPGGRVTIIRIDDPSGRATVTVTSE